MKIVLIGAGNLATHLGKALHAAGHDMVQVFSRTMQSAETLASLLDAEPLTDISQVRDDADVYIFSVKDSALEQLISRLCGEEKMLSGEEQLCEEEKKVFLHTAGSMPMSVFRGKALHYGVLYPMQTFSKQREVDFSIIPCFIEANDEFAQKQIEGLAVQISHRVYQLSSEDRRYLHLCGLRLQFRQPLLRCQPGTSAAAWHPVRCDASAHRRNCCQGARDDSEGCPDRTSREI